jgi:hypothetical protein
MDDIRREALDHLLQGRAGLDGRPGGSELGDHLDHRPCGTLIGLAVLCGDQHLGTVTSQLLC